MDQYRRDVEAIEKEMKIKNEEKETIEKKIKNELIDLQNTLEKKI